MKGYNNTLTVTCTKYGARKLALSMEKVMYGHKLLPSEERFTPSSAKTSILASKIQYYNHCLLLKLVSN